MSLYVTLCPEHFLQMFECLAGLVLESKKEQRGKFQQQQRQSEVIRPSSIYDKKSKKKCC